LEVFFEAVGLEQVGEFESADVAALGADLMLKVGAGGKVGHPQVVDKRRLEALGGAAQRLAQLLTPGFGVQLMLPQEPVDGPGRG
jgi:hypothetical protein